MTDPIPTTESELAAVRNAVRNYGIAVTETAFVEHIAVLLQRHAAAVREQTIEECAHLVRALWLKWNKRHPNSYEEGRADAADAIESAISALLRETIND